jgi:hypothetical protein
LANVSVQLCDYLFSLRCFLARFAERVIQLDKLDQSLLQFRLRV